MSVAEVHPNDPALILELSDSNSQTCFDSNLAYTWKPTSEYKCNKCDKAFTQLCNLRQHERIHTNQRPYTCLVCTKQFKQMGHLQTHIRALHTGEKPYMCPVETCTQSFHQQGNMKEHIQRTHSTNKRPARVTGVLCDVCGKMYINNKSLRAHMNKAKGFCSYRKDNMETWETVNDGPKDVGAEETVASSSTLPYPYPNVLKGPKPGVSKRVKIVKIMPESEPLGTDGVDIICNPTQSDDVMDSVDWLEIASFSMQPHTDLFD